MKSLVPSSQSPHERRKKETFHSDLTLQSVRCLDGTGNQGTRKLCLGPAHEQVPELTAGLLICANINSFKMWVLFLPFLLFVGTFMFFAGLPVSLAGLFNFFKIGRLGVLKPLAEASMCS